MDVRVRWRPAVDGGLVEWDQSPTGACRLVYGRPTRKPGSRRGQRNYPGVMWMATTGSMVLYESLLERDRLWLADFDPDVVAVAAQPVLLSGRDCPDRNGHFPDFMLEHRNGRVTVVDVKPEHRLTKPEVVAQFEWTGKACAHLGWGYEVWSGADPVVLSNITYLAAGRRLFLLNEVATQVVASVGVSGMTLADAEAAAAAHVEDHATVRLSALALLWFGQWSVDMSIPLSGESVLTCRDVAA